MQPDPSAWRELNDQEVRQYQLAALRLIAEYCRSHDLTFYLCAGSLLGAVRHKGFIPWDDDIDLMMPRDDYERLLAQSTQVRDATGLCLHSLETDQRWSYPFAKITDPRTLVLEASDSEDVAGLGADIFPLDNWQPGLAGDIQKILLKALRLFFSAKMIRPSPSRAVWKNMIVNMGHAVLGPLPARSIGAALNRLGGVSGSRAWSHSGVMVWDYREQVPVEAYGEPIAGPFEGAEYPIPRDSDAVLTALYGDYMQLPSPEARQSHHGFTAYGPISPSDAPSDRGA